MGGIEKKLKRQARITKTKQAILASVKVAGFLSIALLAPNALKILEMFGDRKIGTRRKKYTVNRSVSKLIESGYLKLKKTERGSFVRLTSHGETLLARVEASNFNIKKPKKWDGKYRIIIFDIKEARRGLRDKLRATLLAIGFKHLQHSVWVYPYDCEDLINLLKADFKIGKDVLYMVVDFIENDWWIRQHFGLPKPKYQ